MAREFYSIAQKSSAQLQEKKSLFIAYACPVETEDEAQAFIESIKNKHHDAKHHVYAYQIGDDNQIKRYTDDKEPSGTAGKPTLEAIDKSGLKNTAIVVARYFGGILLGSGGLTRAYGKAAAMAIAAAVIVKKIPAKKYQITFDYHYCGKVETWLGKRQYPIEKRLFDQIIAFTILVPYDQESQIKKEFMEITLGTGSLLDLGEEGFIILK
ncbi:MAG: YigZ family protein [Bacillota bacterium]